MFRGTNVRYEMKRIRVGRKQMEGVRDNENVNLIFEESFERD